MTTRTALLQPAVLSRPAPAVRFGLPRSPSQFAASLAFDSALLARLLASTPDRREHQRLTRLQCEHAGAWVSAVPSSLDGLHTVFPPRTFRTAVAIRLGVPVLPEVASCPFCKQSMDLLGDHASCCEKTGDTLVRHNRIRDLVDAIVAAGCCPRSWKRRASWATPRAAARVCLRTWAPSRLTQWSRGRGRQKRRRTLIVLFVLPV